MENDYQEDDQQGGSKSLKGYKIIIILLVVILGAISFQYFRQIRQLRADFAVERDTLTNRLANIITDLDGLKTENDSISYNLGVERLKADSIMERLQKERSINRATIRKYEKELGTLRTTMRHYVGQIDSLNRLNQSLVAENVTFRKQVTTEKMRADAAEEAAQEMSNKIRTGAIVNARDISLQALNNNDKTVSRVARAERLRVNFTLSSNNLAKPGERAVYVRLIGPDGYVMSNDPDALFSYQGDAITYSAMREIDYQNSDLSVSLYYNGQGIVSGTYKIEVYMDGTLAGEGEQLMR